MVITGGCRPLKVGSTPARGIFYIFTRKYKSLKGYRLRKSALDKGSTEILDFNIPTKFKKSRIEYLPGGYYQKNKNGTRNNKK